jgi:hypothetical protein
MPGTDKALPENSQGNLDRKLDHAIDETFPTSDPVSVTITKGGAIDYDEDGRSNTPASDRSGHADETPMDRVKDVVQNVSEAATKATRNAYEQGRRYASAARDRYPDAERYYREGTEAVRQQAGEYPLVTLLVGVGIGYAVAWMIHGAGSTDRRVPDYARTRRAYAPHAGRRPG